MTAVKLRGPEVVREGGAPHATGDRPDLKVSQVHSVYFPPVFLNAGRRLFRGRPAVRVIDPADWPYPPEPGCKEDWEAAGE